MTQRPERERGVDPGAELGGRGGEQRGGEQRGAKGSSPNGGGGLGYVAAELLGLGIGGLGGGSRSASIAARSWLSRPDAPGPGWPEGPKLLVRSEAAA